MSARDDRHEYCFLDLDLDDTRNKLATCAAFVDSTDLTYGFSSKNLLALGGSEISRLKELIATDHEWASKDTACGGIVTQPPPEGNRIVVKLYWDVAPLACENFATLCSNGSAPLPQAPGQKAGKPKPVPIGDCGKPLTYRGCKVHRVVPGFVLQGGDFVLENGSGGECVFNNKKTFKDERAGLNLKHDRFGLLSMGNSGKNSNSSQFFFTLDKAPQCDGKHVVFGEVVSGKDVLKKAESFGAANGTPTAPIRITDCGGFVPLASPGAGYWYDQPDAESWNGISPTFVVRPRVAVAAPEAALVKFEKALGGHCSVVLSIGVDSADADADAGEGTKAPSELLKKSLATFATDVVLIAPACRDLVSKLGAKLPDSWKEHDSNIAFDEVVLVAKPLDALSAIHAKSWVSGHRAHWQLDGQ
mmetsp:Transcript_6848/g.19838  ORF Transcript_6848/g.19838 Transcript_6848/m.19838 type:complete len:417 (+) Transcript_6848:188-1438(+)|eukprot:CAMPEP_0172376622 /NCGR_PEP_ID=MMETSP1060-20121228/68039_1 /TAXON_ID=37318 /ORGANISM="Pseudo-nitzschia pungens, Strain cf. cingulata" /LENGTH=416 /DNA_ID=CAMNT_0013104243 /DNA_START=143 /DNA_END=1393 /DNA_ORIENTATION=+